MKFASGFDMLHPSRTLLYESVQVYKRKATSVHAVCFLTGIAACSKPLAKNGTCLTSFFAVAPRSNGKSFSTLMGILSREDETVPTLLVVKDGQGGLLGGFAPCKWERQVSSLARLS